MGGFTGKDGRRVDVGAQSDASGRAMVTEAMRVAVVGKSVATVTAADHVAVPTDSNGDAPRRCRLSATKDCHVRPMNPVSVAGKAVVAGGAGYVADEVLTLAGGTFVTAAKVTVDTVDGLGAILTCHVSDAGSYVALPADPVAVGATTGVGAGATFDLTWSGSAALATSDDLMLCGGQSLVLDVDGFSRLTYVRDSADGRLQVQPLED